LSQMPTAIGIDLGTTFSCVAYMKSDKKVEVIENHYGNKITPSVVHFGSAYKEVGEEAQAKRGTDPLNTVFQIKRFMGRSANDQEITKRPYPFEILANRKGDASIRVTPLDGKRGRIESKTFCPEQISSYILRYMMVLARSKIGEDVIDAVITVPANFDNAQRQATKDAAEMAGLNVLRILNEPTAAALAYGFGMNSEETRTVLVYDLGGGTFDVSIVRSHGLEEKVLSTAGVTDLGGEDFDRRLFEHASAELKERGVSVTLEEEFGLYKSCEEAKKTLSVSEKTTITLYKNGKGHTVDISRDEFEDLCVDLFEKTIECMEEAIEEAGVDKYSIDDIVLVGGSSRIPLVQKMVREFFEDKELKFNIPPDHAVACGAAILAGSLSSSLEMDRSSIRGAVTLADVLPHSLGTNLTHDRMSVILKKNLPYPVKNTSSYCNASDNLQEMFFKILEGESLQYTKNKELGCCSIKVPPRKVEENLIYVTFSIDDNGILSVHLRDRDTNEESSIKVQTSKLSKEERMKMVNNARKEEENEKEERKKLEARNEYAESVMSGKRGVHKSDCDQKKEELKRLIQMEEEWFKGKKDPTNDELIRRTSNVKERISTILSKEPY
ncbi:hypothetical protein PMAYCL1PPCAC_02293, partial [Pristionchus mayeri]